MRHMPSQGARNVTFRSRVEAAVRDLKFGLAYGFHERISHIRWAFFTRLGRRVPRYMKDGGKSGGLDYSRSHFNFHRPLSRVKWPLFLLSSIPDLVFDEHGMSTGRHLLIIGPRYESEIFLAESLGWRRNRVSAIDLLTYSPRVTQADMHAMPFPPSSFEAVVCGWTLSYSMEPDVAVREIDRVCAPGAVVVFGVEVSDSAVNSIADIPSGVSRVQSTAQLLNLMPGYELVAHFEPLDRGNLVVALRKPFNEVK